MTSKPPALATLFAEHSGKVSDKWSIYISEYDRLFQPYRGQPVRLLEIGIQNGGSLEIWGKYFTKAVKLIGCDINPDCAQLQFDDPRIAVVVADANTDETQQLIFKLSPEFDLIIDDGSHQSGDIVRSFARYFTHLNDGGLYIAEDLHCSYWQDFEGGLYQPYSSIAFFKQLADTINHEHWGIDKTRTELLRSFNRQYNTRLDEISLAHIHSIEFINSMCVIRKAIPADNVLGQRFIAGSHALVWDGALLLHGNSNQHPNQNTNQWTTREMPINEELMVRLQEIDNLHHSASERDKKSADLIRVILERNQNVFQRAFDAEWYVNKYPDIDTASVDPYQHYITYGILEGRIPSANITKFIRDGLLDYLNELHAQHNQATLLTEAQRLQLADHEKEYSERTHVLNQELHRLQADNATREQVHANITEALRNELTTLLRRQAQREQEIATQLLASQQQSNIDKTELNQQHQSHVQEIQRQQAEHEWLTAERIHSLNQELHRLQADNAAREQVHAETVDALQNELANHLRAQVQREQETAAQWLAFQQQAKQELAELARSHREQEQALHQQHAESEQELNKELLAKQNDLYQLTQNWLEAEQLHAQTLNQLRHQLHTLRATYSWRWTAPLRNLARLLGKNDSLEETNTAILSSPPTLNLPKDGPASNKAAYQNETQNKSINNQSASDPLTESNATQIAGILDMHLNQPNTAATSLDELLSYYDEGFIHSAYHTVLGRAPDAEGLRYYLARLRSGISKVEILAQLRLGTEGKLRQVTITGLDKALKRHKLLKTPLLGALLQIAGIRHPDGNVLQSLRILDNKIYVLNINLLGNLTQINNQLKQIINKPTQYSNKSKLLEQEPFELEPPIKFDADWYLEQNTDVAASGANPLEHYLLYGKNEGRHPIFDADWYLSQYPDVAKSGMSPREHYIKYGKAQGRHPAFDENWYLNRYPDVEKSGMDAHEHYLQYGRAEGRQPAYSPYVIDQSNYPKWIQEFDTLTDSIRYGMRAHIAQFEHQPRISVVMPVYNPNPIWLVEAIESVRKQIYPNWELCIADDASPDKTIHSILEQYTQADKRIKVVFREKNGHISAASNSALSIAQGEWIALLDHDDLLAEHALFWVADAINQHRDCRMIYSDSDNILEQGVRASPFFKCDWNPDLFYSHNFFSHLGVYHAELVRSIGGFRIGMEGSQDYDLALRCIEKINTSQIHHIPRILYHWRVHAESTAFSSDAKPYAMIAGANAINEHFNRKGINATVELIGYGYKVKYPLPDILPLVSLIIPTRNGLSLLRQCVDSILTKTTYANYEILIVDNGSDDAATLRYLQELTVEKRIRVIRDDRPFNYSALNNAAVKIARGEVVGLINNDIEVISPNWLSEMVSHALRPEVGAVGARLWYPNDTLQHGGVILGIGGAAGHSHKGLRRDQYGYFNRASLVQNYSAITAACLVIKKNIYEEVLGLNEINLSIAYNDVDFCIRVREAGYRNIWTPYAELYHHESATRGYEDTPEKKARLAKEMKYLMEQWGNLLLNDPSYSPNLTLDKEDFSLAWPPRISSYESFVIPDDTSDEVQQKKTQNRSLNVEVEITPENFDADGYLKSNPDVKKHGLDAYDHYINYGKKEGRIAFRKGFGFPQLLQINDEKYDLLISKSNSWPRKPLISIIMPTYNTSEIWLRQALDSVINQAYPQWELCVADDASTLPHVKQVLNEYAHRDARIKVFFRKKNGRVSAASNNALALVTGEFTALFDHDDLLERHALYYLAESILEDSPDIIYSDELLVNEQADGVIYHEFRPVFSLELLRSHPYIVHLVAFRTTLLRKIGGFDENLTISQDYDLILRAVELAKKIVHIPKALYRWRIHDSSSGHTQKDQVMATSKKILADHLARCGENAEVFDGKYFNYFETRYALESNLRVAIIIPTKNHGELVRQCIDSINETVSGVNYDIVIIDHDSNDIDSINYINEISSQYIVLKYSGEFNFSAINNWAIKQLNDQYSHYLLCNNDIEAIHSGWLERMLELGQKPDIGMVGAKLFYPDFTIQHAGVCVGMFGAAEHYGKFIENSLPDGSGINPGYIGSLIANHEMSALTAACVLIRRDVFETVNGFDEKIKVGYGDVDLCLRVRQAGYRIVFCPHAELIHHESLSRGKSATDQHPEDTLYFINRWHSFIANGDPYYNPNLSLNNTTWSLKNPSLFPLSENMEKRRSFIKSIPYF